MKECDADKSGSLSKDEVIACMVEHGDMDQKEAEKEVDEHWKKADKNGDGELSKKELRKAIKAHRKEHSLAQNDKESLATIWGHILKKCDKDGSSTLSWKEARKCGAPR